MTPERYCRLIELFDEAARRSPSERPLFLTQSCAGDEELLREVNVMLDADSQTGGLLEHPAADLAAAVLAAEQSVTLARGWATIK